MVEAIRSSIMALDILISVWLARVATRFLYSKGFLAEVLGWFSGLRSVPERVEFVK